MVMPVENILTLIIFISVLFGFAGYMLALSYGHIRRYRGWEMISDLGIGIFYGGLGIAAISAGFLSYFILV
jgi:hypothetical protein